MKFKDCPIPHPALLAAEVAVIAARTKAVAAQSVELLKLAEPDTFLGRRHYPLLPLSDQDRRRVPEGLEDNRPGSSQDGGSRAAEDPAEA